MLLEKFLIKKNLLLKDGFISLFLVASQRKKDKPTIFSRHKFNYKLSKF